MLLTVNSFRLNFQMMAAAPEIFSFVGYSKTVAKYNGPTQAEHNKLWA